jgi:hypothetical protein
MIVIHRRECDEELAELRRRDADANQRQRCAREKTCEPGVPESLARNSQDACAAC